jgi:hypothetical protein
MNDKVRTREYLESIQLNGHTVQWRYLVNTIMKLLTYYVEQGLS